MNSLKAKQNHKEAPGFTLIELVVVIAIIAILAAASLLSFSGSSKKARDARRKRDLKAIQTAMEVYYQDNNKYPSTGGWVYSGTGGDWINGTSSPTIVPKYMKVTPADPINTTPACGPWTATTCFDYAVLAPSTTGTCGYVLIARLENTSDVDAGTTSARDDAGTICYAAAAGLYVLGPP